MPDDAPFDPCRAWLGIDAADLVAAHLVLGIAATETDPLVIVRAADRRLTGLRTFDPGVFAAARDALVNRVEECRDAMLAGAVAARSLGAPPTAVPAAPPLAPPPPPTAAPVAPPAVAPPPPVPARPESEGIAIAATHAGSGTLPRLHPPPPPSTLPGAAWPAASRSTPVVSAPPPVPTSASAPPVPPAGDESRPALAGFDGPSIAVGRPVMRRSDSGSGGALAATMALLAVTAAALALYVMWPQLTGKSDRGRDVATVEPDPPRTPQPQPDPPPKIAPTPPPRPQPSPEPPRPPDPKPSPSPRDDAMRKTDPPEPRPQPPPRPQPVPPPQPPPEPDPMPMVDPAEVRARVSKAVGAAWKALRRGEFDTVTREIAAAADVAVDDQQSADRVAAWQQLATYARGYPEYRDQALEAANAGREYMVAGRPVAIVEVRPSEIIVRDRGRNQSVPRDAIPPALEMAIVSAWFAADGRAANHLFLGAAYLAREEPDLAAARREWEEAAQGGEPDGRLLLRLLDEPAVRGD